MSIPAQVNRQRDFSAGAINPDAERRDDSDVFKFGVREARNLQFLRTGGLERRYGRRWLYSDRGVRDEFRPFPGFAYSVTFADARLTIRNEAYAVVKTLAAPWAEADLDSLVWDFFENRIVVCGRSPLRPQVITVDPKTKDWTIANFDFSVGLAGKIHAPFYRFSETKGVTMLPSALSGAITLTFSAGILDSTWVNVVVRYAGRQVRITSIVSATVANATVIEKLHPTVRWECTNADEVTFAVGEIVSTSNGGIEAEVVQIDVPNKYVYGVILNRYRKSTLGGAGGERLIGPSADAYLQTETLVTPLGATTQWDEIFISTKRGWPQSVSSDSQRLIFCDFPQFKQAIIWSTTQDYLNLLIGADATSAIFEYIPGEARVYHVVGGYDEFVITDTGVFYIPISPETPLAPGVVEFRLIFAGQVSAVRPVQVTEGVLFVDESRTGVYAITATGQTARPYIASEITELHRHLFTGIKAIAAGTGTPSAASRQIFAVNYDGTLVIGQYSAERGYVGWLKWTGFGVSAGTVQAISSRYNDIVLTTIYQINAASFRVAEKLDSTTLLDCSISNTSDGFMESLELATGQPLTLNDNSPLHLSLYTAGFLAGMTVQVVADGFYLGNTVVASNGDISGFAAYVNVTIGFTFDWNLKPNLPAFEGGEAFGQRLRRRKVSKVMAKVRDTQEFKIGNRLVAGYEAGDDTALPMPQRTDVFRYRQTGRSFDPEYELSQSIPGKFKLLELTTELTV